jgi:hypothetical protein
MKTKQIMLATALVLTLAPVALNAQVNFGFKNGVSISTLSKIGNMTDNDNFTAAYTAGILASRTISKSVAIQVEINYQRKGRSEETVAYLSDSKISRSFDYLQLPVLFRYDFAPAQEGKTRVFFNAGPYASLLLHANNRISSGTDLAADAQEGKVKSTDFGAVVGTGCMVPILKQTIQFDLRYDMGILPVIGRPLDYQTKALTITAGIRF